MSPDQVSLAQRFSDVIINDIAMARNKYGLPLNIFVVIDQFFKTRNIAYALHNGETANEHQWALDCLFEVLPQCSTRVFFSDADKGLDLAVSRRSEAEISFHGRCLNHLDGNIVKKLAPILGLLFQSFREAFGVPTTLSPPLHSKMCGLTWWPSIRGQHHTCNKKSGPIRNVGHGPTLSPDSHVESARLAELKGKIVSTSY
jgi:hypothetical protein